MPPTYVALKDNLEMTPNVDEAHIGKGPSVWKFVQKLFR